MAKKNYDLILIARNEHKVKNLADEILKKSGSAKVRYEVIDLESESAIKGLSTRIDSPVDVLINNAAIAPVQREETSEGLEMQFAVNIMSYVWMTIELYQNLKNAPRSRIVNVASYYAGDLDVYDLQFLEREYNNNTAYRQSKAANRILSYCYSEEYKKNGITVNSCHPGEVNSNLSNDLGFGGYESPEKGAETPVWLATDSYVNEATGKYFEYLTPTSDRFSMNDELNEALYQECMKYCS